MNNEEIADFKLQKIANTSDLDVAIKRLKRKDRCVAKIKDSGKGMSKADVGKLFEPYFTTKENGHGLGLTNTQNIILSHNANIVAESELNKGTTFTVTFNYA